MLSVMSPNTGVVTLLLFLTLAPARAADARRPPEQSSESERHYQAGLTRYARGDREGALAEFREALRRDPEDRTSIAAVRRLRAEVGRAEPAPRTSDGKAEEPLLERLLVKIPRWYHFGRTIGNSLSAAGTAQALNARIGQLLGERRLALAGNRRFRHERRLRELIRRSSLAAQDDDEA